MVYTPFNAGDENIYAMQAAAAARGELFSGEYFTGLPWLGPVILGFFAKITSVEAVFILADFILPAVIFLLLYRLIRQLKAEPGLAAVGSLGSLFIYQLLTKINPLDWLKPTFFNFNRLIPPQLTFVFFLVFLLALVRSSIWSGVWAGVLAYVYFYHWSAAWVILLLKRQWRALIIAGFISLPYLWQASQATLEQQWRFGRIEGHFFEPLTTIRYLIVIGLVYSSRLPLAAKKLFYSVFGAAIFLMNLQLVTGYTIAPGHWPSSTFEPLVPLVLVVIFGRFLIKHWHLAAGLILAYAFMNQIRISQAWQSMYWITPKEQQLFNQLNQLSEPVVLSLDKRINFFLPVLTTAKPYLPYGSYSSLTNEELWHRFICALALSDLKPEEVEAALNDTQLIGHLFDLTYNQGLTVFSFGRRRLPEELKQSVSNRLAAGPDCPEAIDYIIKADGRLYAAQN